MSATFLEKAKRSFVSDLLGFARFLQRPELSRPAEETFAARTAKALSLLALSLLVTLIFGLFALPLFLALEAAPGDRLEETLSGSAMSIIVPVIVLGPLIEEMMFRGWLSGTWRALFSSALALLAVYGGATLVTPWLGESGTLKQLALFVAALAVFWVSKPLDAGARIPGFYRIFPLLFWAQGIAFGVLHFQNLAASSLALSIASTLPLVACGVIWGYARIKLGLGWAVAVHAAYNVPAALGTILMLHLSS